MADPCQRSVSCEPGLGVLGSRSALLTCHFGSFRRVCGDTHHLMEVLDSGRKNLRRRRTETPLRIEDPSGHHLEPVLGLASMGSVGRPSWLLWVQLQVGRSRSTSRWWSRSRRSVPPVQLSPAPPQAPFPRLLRRQEVRRGAESPATVGFAPEPAPPSPAHRLWPRGW